MPQSSIDAIRATLSALLTSLEAHKSDTIPENQSDFSRAVDVAKSLLDQGKIEVDVRGLPAAMHIYATRDLPDLITDEKNHPSIIKELYRFQRVMDKVVSPKGVE
jgi:hypothetical protein